MLYSVIIETSASGLITARYLPIINKTPDAILVNKTNIKMLLTK